MRPSAFTLWRLAASVVAVLGAPFVGRVMAQDMDSPAAAPTCGATPAAPPADLAGWSNATRLASAADPAGLTMATIAPGAAEVLTLQPAAKVRLAAPTGARAPAANAAGFSGMVRLKITEPGSYRVALSSPAWIDLVAGGTAVAATGHGHGPACTGIRKIVTFTLQPGDHVLQVFNSREPAVTVLVAPAA